MYRREALRRLAAMGVAATLAGCGSSEPDEEGSQGPPEAPDDSGPSGGTDGGLVVASIDYREDDSGNLVVLVTIENGGQESRSGTLKTTVGLGGETLTESTDVTVEAGGSEDVEVPFEASFEAFEEEGSINLDIEEA